LSAICGSWCDGCVTHCYLAELEDLEGSQECRAIDTCWLLLLGSHLDSVYPVDLEEPSFFSTVCKAWDHGGLVTSTGSVQLSLHQLYNGSLT
jgi:hypothetical protein